MNRLIYKLLLKYSPSLQKQEKKILLLINILIIIFLMVASAIFLYNSNTIENIKIENEFLLNLVNSNIGLILFQGLNVNYSIIILTFLFILTFLLFIIFLAPIYLQIMAAGILGNLIRIVIQNYGLGKDVLISIPVIDYTIKKVLSYKEKKDIYFDARDQYLNSIGIEPADLNFFYEYTERMFSQVVNFENKEEIINKTQEKYKELYDLYLIQKQNASLIENSSSYIETITTFVSQHWVGVSVVTLIIITVIGTVIAYKYGIFGNENKIILESNNTINNSNNLISSSKNSIINGTNKISGGDISIVEGKTTISDGTIIIKDSNVTINGGNITNKDIVASDQISLDVLKPTEHYDPYGSPLKEFVTEVENRIDTVRNNVDLMKDSPFKTAIDKLADNDYIICQKMDSMKNEGNEVLRLFNEKIKDNSDKIQTILEKLQQAGIGL